MASNLNVTFGKNIRIFRKHLNFTMVQMAKEVPMSQSFLSQVENGKKDLTLDMMGKIVNFFICASGFTYNEVIKILFNQSDDQALKELINSMNLDK